MRVLVAGAAGFVGSHLCDRLLADGHEVQGVDDLSTGLLSATAEARDSKHFRFHRLDLAAGGLPELLARADPEVVVHAALSGEAGRDVAATVALVDAARTARVLLVGSGAVYGRAALPVTERSRLAPLSTRAAVEVAREAVVEAAGRAGLRAVVLRVGTVYGTRDRCGPVGRLLGRAATLSGGRLSGAAGLADAGGLSGGGGTVRDLVHVDDLGEVVVRCLSGAADGRRLNVGTGTGTTDRDLHTAVAAALGRADAPEFEAGPYDPDLVLDCAAARRLLGWQAAVDLSSGLARTLQTT